MWGFTASKPGSKMCPFLISLRSRPLLCTSRTGKEGGHHSFPTEAHRTGQPGLESMIYVRPSLGLPTASLILGDLTAHGNVKPRRCPHTGSEGPSGSPQPERTRQEARRAERGPSVSGSVQWDTRGARAQVVWRASWSKGHISRGVAGGGRAAAWVSEDLTRWPLWSEASCDPEPRCPHCMFIHFLVFLSVSPSRIPALCRQGSLCFVLCCVLSA